MESKNIYTLKDVSKIMNKSESTIRTWKRVGAMPQELFKKVGGTIFVIKPKFDEWLVSQ